MSHQAKGVIVSSGRRTRKLRSTRKMPSTGTVGSSGPLSDATRQQSLNSQAASKKCSRQSGKMAPVDIKKVTALDAQASIVSCHMDTALRDVAFASRALLLASAAADKALSAAKTAKAEHMAVTTMRRKVEVQREAAVKECNSTQAQLAIIERVARTTVWGGMSLYNDNSSTTEKQLKDAREQAKAATTDAKAIEIQLQTLREAELHAGSASHSAEIGAVNAQTLVADAQELLQKAKRQMAIVRKSQLAAKVLEDNEAKQRHDEAYKLEVLGKKVGNAWCDAEIDVLRQNRDQRRAEIYALNALLAAHCTRTCVASV